MDLFYRKSLTVRRSYMTTVWTYTDAREAHSIADVFIREPGGLRYLRTPYVGDLPAASNLYYVAYQKGVLSPRPLDIRYVRDDSMFYSALALTVSCCKAWNLDPIALALAADQHARVTHQDLRELKAHARWEEVVFPGTWDTTAIDALVDALAYIECAALAKLLIARTVQARGY